MGMGTAFHVRLFAGNSPQGMGIGWAYFMLGQSGPETLGFFQNH